MKQFEVTAKGDGKYYVGFDGLTIEQVVDAFEILIKNGVVDRGLYTRVMDKVIGDAPSLEELYKAARLQSEQIDLEEAIAEVEGTSGAQ